MVGIPTKNKKADVDRAGEVQRQIDRLTILMAGVVIALLIGFAVMFMTIGTLVWNAHMWGRDTYQELIRELDENNDKIDILIQKTSPQEISPQETPPKE